MNFIKKVLNNSDIKHPKCSHCGKEIKGITYKGMDIPPTNTFSCGCNKNLKNNN